jgi:hypothetical protein
MKPNEANRAIAQARHRRLSPSRRLVTQHDHARRDVSRFAKRRQMPRETSSLLTSKLPSRAGSSLSAFRQLRSTDEHAMHIASIIPIVLAPFDPGGIRRHFVAVAARSFSFGEALSLDRCLLCGFLRFPRLRHANAPLLGQITGRRAIASRRQCSYQIARHVTRFCRAYSCNRSDAPYLASGSTSRGRLTGAALRHRVDANQPASPRPNRRALRDLRSRDHCAVHVASPVRPVLATLDPVRIRGQQVAITNVHHRRCPSSFLGSHLLCAFLASCLLRGFLRFSLLRHEMPPLTMMYSLSRQCVSDSVRDRRSDLRGQVRISRLARGTSRYYSYRPAI